MADNSSCASSAASTPLMTSKPLAINISVVQLPPPSTTASATNAHWTMMKSMPRGDQDDFRPPGLSCFSPAPEKTRGDINPIHPRQPLAALGAPNEESSQGLVTALRDKSGVPQGAAGRSGKAVTTTRSRPSKTKPYDPTGAPPPLKEALYTASRLQLGSGVAPEGNSPTFQPSHPNFQENWQPPSSVDPMFNHRPTHIKVVGDTGDGKPNTVPITPSVPSSPRVPTPAPSTEAPDPSIHLSLPHRMKASSDQAPDPALAWTSIPASIPTAIHHQPAPISYPRSYPHLPQWERISSLRSDYATNALAVQASSLEIHARDYRAGILLLSLLDVLRDRKKYIDARTMELRKLAWNVAEMKEIGCSWREMGITEAHASANEFFKSIWGCEFEDINLAEDGTISGDWLRLKEDGTSGASLPVGHMPSYPDGVHLPSMEHLIGIPMRRADGKMGEFDIQKMGNAFAQAPFEVLKGLVRGVDGSRYAPLEI